MRARPRRFVRCGPSTVRRRKGWVVLAIEEDGHNNPHWWLPCEKGRAQAIQYAKHYRKKWGCWTYIARTELAWPKRLRVKG